jgi:predicted nucleotidyltransferase
MPDAATLAGRIDALARAWRADPEIAAVWLFGSRAAGRPRAWSDVDLAVLLAGGLDRRQRATKQAALAIDAGAQLLTDAIDLIVLEDAPTVLGHRIVSRGRLLAVRDESRTVSAVEDVLRRYLDEAPLRATLDAGLADRIREGRYAR